MYFEKIQLFSIVIFFQSKIIAGQNNNCMDKNVAGRPSDCPRVVYLCKNPLYKMLMDDQCPMTCGACGSGSGSGMDECQDKSASGRASDCLQMKAYCTNPIYKDLMNDQCGATCGICGSGSGSGNG